ncbi:MAG: hypothetical protein ACXVJT_00740 [Thermoanaerobaculia bacterium]
MRRTLYAVVALCVLLTGCKAKELAEKAAIARDLNKSGSTIDLMKKTAEDKYTPPADGKLTDGQVKMYLKVREHEKQIVQVAKEQMQAHSKAADASKNTISGMVEGFKTMGSAADLATADIRAAQELGFNSQEYLWVKGQILAVSSTAMAEKMSDALNAQMDASYRETKKNYDEAKDEATKKAFADSLATIEKTREAAKLEQQKDPALVYNKELLSHYENALTAILNETAKYADAPQQDVSKTAADLEKKLEEAKQKAEKQQ